MFVIREVLHCKPGKVRQMLEKFGHISAVLKELGQEPMRLMTDVTGEPFGPSWPRRRSSGSRTSSPSSRNSWPANGFERRWRTITTS